MTTTALAIRDDQSEFDGPQIAVLQQLGMKNAGREDLAVFFHHARRTGLDPFARQIYMIERWTKDGPRQTIQTGIDGLRLVAQRTAERTGQPLSYDDTLWCGDDGQWRDVWIAPHPPAAAKVTVHRGPSTFSAVALFNEYAARNKNGNLSSMWESKGALMIAKCAEALALRKAFPQDLSGLYTGDEMAQAGNPAPQLTTPTPTAPGDGEAVEQRQRMGRVMRDLDVPAGERLALIASIVGRPIESRDQVTEEDAAAVADHLEQHGVPTAGDTPVDGEVVDDPDPEGTAAD